MRTAAEEAALSAFIDAATSDADPGYPRGTAFIPWERNARTDRLLWRYLREGRTVVLVADGVELDLLIEPLSRGAFARLRAKLMRRIGVAVSCRDRKTSSPSPKPIRLEIGRHAIGARLAPEP
jgi:hypothetical protein